MPSAAAAVARIVLLLLIARAVRIFVSCGSHFNNPHRPRRRRRAKSFVGSREIIALILRYQRLKSLAATICVYSGRTLNRLRRARVKLAAPMRCKAA